MKESRPEKNAPKIEFEQEREEIAKIAMMLTERRDIFFLLGVAQGLIELEVKETPPIN